MIWRNLAALSLATFISVSAFMGTDIETWRALVFFTAPASILAAMALRFPGDAA